MLNSFRNNKMYYACQLIGTFLFFCMIVILNATTEESSPEIHISEIIQGFISTILISHFFVRQRIKTKTNNSNFNIKVYVTAIVMASVISYTSNIVINEVFGSWLNKPELEDDVNALHDFFYNLLFFTGWATLYLAITSIRDKHKLAKQLKEQQLSSLMNQVNPHFLFNSLNTIRGMIYEDQDKAAELVTQFASLFRYNLSLDTKKTTFLADELKICEQYLAIESIRLGSRLKININIPVECHHCKIPTMGLFTLVENAIKHGIAHLQKGGELSIKTEKNNNELIINVSNPYDKSLVKSGTKIGLHNLQQRIKLLFPDGASLNQKAVDNTFQVTLILPYELVNNV